MEGEGWREGEVRASVERAPRGRRAHRRLASPLIASYVAKKEAAAGTAGAMAAEMPPGWG